jgi:hypothetical protein
VARTGWTSVIVPAEWESPVNRRGCAGPAVGSGQAYGFLLRRIALSLTAALWRHRKSIRNGGRMASNGATASSSLELRHGR